MILVYALYLTYLLRNKDKIRTEESEVIEDVKGSNEISWIAGAYLVMVVGQEAWFLTLWIIIPFTIGGVIWCLFFMWTGFKFNRSEGIGLIAFYALFLMALYMEHIGIIGPT